MYFDNKASKHDTTHDKFSSVYLHPSKSKDTFTQRHSETRGYPLLPTLHSSGTPDDERTLHWEQKVVSDCASPEL